MKIEVYSPTIRRKEMDAVLTAMVEDRIGPGERSRLLLSTAKEYLRFDFALSLRSPAIALMLALKALNPEKGQSVIISALSPRYYINVIQDMGLSVLYCDVSLTFPCMSRETIEQALAEKNNGSGALCVVLHHTLGYVPDTASVAELGLPVIEDISQSFNFSGSGRVDANQADTSKERRHGTFTILGLEERDMLTAGGGALLYAANRRDGMVLRNFTDLPPEFCLPDINAALAVVQFREARRNIQKRAAIADMYIKSALRTRHKRFIPLTRSLEQAVSGEASEIDSLTYDDTEYNNFTFSLVLETGLNDVLSYARKKDIILENAFDNTAVGVSGNDALNCPASYSLSLRTALFPLYPRLRSAEAERVSKLIATLP
jgi:dTDP-4-amino-4,6-dideoxygalactose transaminase